MVSKHCNLFGTNGVSSVAWPACLGLDLTTESKFLDFSPFPSPSSHNSSLTAVNLLPGVQYVPGDSLGLRHGPQGGPAGLAVCPAHPAAEENGCRSTRLSPGQSPEGPGYHQVCYYNLHFYIVT